MQGQPFPSPAMEHNLSARQDQKWRIISDYEREYRYYLVSPTTFYTLSLLILYVPALYPKKRAKFDPFPRKESAPTLVQAAERLISGWGPFPLQINRRQSPRKCRVRAVPFPLPIKSYTNPRKNAFHGYVTTPEVRG